MALKNLNDIWGSHYISIGSASFFKASGDGLVFILDWVLCCCRVVQADTHTHVYWWPKGKGGWDLMYLTLQKEPLSAVFVKFACILRHSERFWIRETSGRLKHIKRRPNFPLRMELVLTEKPQRARTGNTGKAWVRMGEMMWPSPRVYLPHVKPQ